MVNYEDKPQGRPELILTPDPAGRSLAGVLKKGEMIMKRVQFVLFFICLFLVAISITTFADAIMIKSISQHGNWAVQSDCTSVYAINISGSAPEEFSANLGIAYDNGHYGMPDIRVHWYSDLKLGAKSQFKFKIADNDLTSYGWICEKNACSPKDNDSAAKILEQLLANEGPFAIIITNNNTMLQATIDTTGLNKAHQALLKHRR